MCSPVLEGGRWRRCWAGQGRTCPGLSSSRWPQVLLGSGPHHSVVESCIYVLPCWKGACDGTPVLPRLQWDSCVIPSRLGDGGRAFPLLRPLVPLVPRFLDHEDVLTCVQLAVPPRLCAGRMALCPRLPHPSGSPWRRVVASLGAPEEETFAHDLHGCSLVGVGAPEASVGAQGAPRRDQPLSWAAVPEQPGERLFSASTRHPSAISCSGGLELAGTQAASPQGQHVALWAPSKGL